MRRLTLVAALAVLAWPQFAAAVGTPAGDTISNQATVSWDALSGPDSGTSNLATLSIDEVIAVTTTLQTVGNVVVVPGAIGELLTYRVENVGNGIEDFALIVFNAAVRDDFDPALNGILIRPGSSRRLGVQRHSGPWTASR